MKNKFFFNIKYYTVLLIYSINIRSCAVVEREVLKYLFDTMKIQQYLQQSQLINSTSLPPIRSLHALPLFLKKNEVLFDKYCFTLTPFYTGIPNGVYFNSNEKYYTDVYNFSEVNKSKFSPDIFDVLSLGININELNFPLLGTLFDTIYIQQHRLGAMLGAQFIINDYMISIAAPLVYQICYPHVSGEVEERISDEFELLFSPEPDLKNDENDFFKKHMVADYLGIDELKVEISKKLIDNFSIKAWGSLFSLIPIDLNLSKGIIGGDFSKTRFQKYVININDILKYYIPADLLTGNTCYNPTKGSELLNNITSNLLDSITDANYNFSFDKRFIYIFPELRFTCIPLQGYEFGVDMNLGIGISKEVWGYYAVHKKHLELRQIENIDTSTITDSEVHQALNIINNELNCNLQYFPFQVTINPGFQAEARVYLNIFDDFLNIIIGFDGWYKEADQIKQLKINNQGFIFDQGEIFQTNQVDAYQLQVFGQLTKSLLFKSMDFNIGLNGFCTLLNNGIGKEIGIGFYFNFNF
jgi:hypothetical protein